MVSMVPAPERRIQAQSIPGRLVSADREGRLVSADRYPRDEALARLLAELRAGSEEFTRIWRTNPVRAPGHRTKTMKHPEAGCLHLNCDVLTVPGDDQQVVFMTADPGSPSASALQWLAATAAA
jgi:MmyB-like transcription regulator ligand binding domain